MLILHLYTARDRHQVRGQCQQSPSVRDLARYAACTTDGPRHAMPVWIIGLAHNSYANERASARAQKMRRQLGKTERVSSTTSSWCVFFFAAGQHLSLEVLRPLACCPRRELRTLPMESIETTPPTINTIGGSPGTPLCIQLNGDALCYYVPHPVALSSCSQQHSSRTGIYT